ncbi:hypothetical protein ABPG75_006445 [Micractinium tetrahymenae]
MGDPQLKPAVHLEARTGARPVTGSGGGALLVPASQLFWLCLVAAVGGLITASPALVSRQGVAARPEAISLPVALPAPTPRRLELPWRPLLTPEEQRRGISYYGSGRALHRVAARLLAGQPIKAYALGGSITGGGGATVGQRAYVPRFFEFIRHNFPHPEHVLVNKGIAASTAFMYAACLQHHVPEDADLVSLEFTVNEAQNSPYQSPERRSFEQLIRRLLARKHPPAVLILHSYGWWNSFGDGMDRGLFYQQPELQLTAFSHFYDVPALSVRAAAYHLMAAGVDKFKVHRITISNRQHLFIENGALRPGTIPVVGKSTRSSVYFADHIHPADPGHQVLAELLAGAVSRAVWEVSAGGALTEAERRHNPSVPALPPPMIPFNADDIPGMCAMLEEFRPVVKEHSGFEYVPERPDAENFMKQKWGWRATEPGSWAELEVDSRASDGSKSSNTYVWLSHLRSYRGMGTARVECVSGCSCSATRLDGTWERKASLFTITRFHVTRHKRCRFRVTVLDKTGEVPQEGHKVVLVAVMVTHVPLDSGGSLLNVQNIGLSLDRGF